MPAYAIDGTFEKRMQQAESDVAREFESLDRELVHREFERVREDLMRNARVTDFVPVLARRHVRENLRLLPSVTTAQSS